MGRITIEEAKVVLATLKKFACHDSAFGDTEITWYEAEPVAVFAEGEEIPEEAYGEADENGHQVGCCITACEEEGGKTGLRRERAFAYLCGRTGSVLTIDDSDGNTIFSTDEWKVAFELSKYAATAMVGENSSVDREEQQHSTLRHLAKTDQPG